MNPPQNSYVEILMPNVAVLGGGAFGGDSVGRERGALMNGISDPTIRKAAENSLVCATI